MGYLDNTSSSKGEKINQDGFLSWHIDLCMLSKKNCTYRCGCECACILQILGNFFAVFVIEISVSMVAFFSCGILLSLFVDPVQVITYVAIYVAAFVCVAYAFGYLFEFIDATSQSQNCLKITIKIAIKVLLLIWIVISVMIFGFTYASIVFFADTRDQLNLFSSVGKLIPVAIAAVAGWGLKDQLQIYFNQVNSNKNEENEGSISSGESV